MGDYIEEFIFYGDDIRIGRFPKETRLLYANPPLPEIADFTGAIHAALDNPLGVAPLEKQLHSTSRVTIAFDDPCLPIPLMIRDTRGIVIEELLKRLFKIGISRERISLICANGLHRKWTLPELSLVLGKKVVSEMAGRISCHDATRSEDLVFLGTTEDGYEVEINRAAVETDALIYVNMNFTSMNGGWKSVLVGLGSWRSIRHHHTPAQWNPAHSIMDPGTSPMHAILRKMSGLVKKNCNLFQIETVANNKVWPSPLDRLLRPVHNGREGISPGFPMKTALKAASLAPQGVKRWVRNAMVRSDYRPCGVHAGDVDQVHEKTLEILFRQQNVAVSEQADVVIYGVPNLSPYSAQSKLNPILLRSLTLGYFLDLFRGKPLVKEGGVIVAYNPGLEKFHPGHHPSYIDFWRNDLPENDDPLICWEKLSESYAENPRYLKLYRDGFAYHGAHVLINWMWSGMGLKHVKGVILAGAREPTTAQKIGFLPEPTLERAIKHAREMAGPSASIVYQVIPPLFCVDV
jgi:lactate racemase